MSQELYYEEPYKRKFEGELTEFVVDDDKLVLTLDKTLFYPEGGGQPADTGKLWNDDLNLRVVHVERNDVDDIKHFCKVDEGDPSDLETGDILNGEIDWGNRIEIMRQHSGQHILTSVFLKKFDAGTSSFNIGEDHTRINIDFDGELTWEEIRDVEEETNELLWNSDPINISWHDEAPDKVRKKSPEVDEIRVVEVGDYDAVPCGGLHVQNTSEVGLVKIIDFSRSSPGKWKIKFLAGKKALNYYQEEIVNLNQMKNYLKAKDSEEVLNRIKKLNEETQELNETVIKLKGRILRNKMKSFEDINILVEKTDLDFKIAEEISKDLLNQDKTLICLVGNGKALIGKNGINLKSNKLLNEVLQKFDGRGGGHEGFAQGGGFSSNKKEQVLKTFKEKIEEKTNIDTKNY